MRRCSRCLLPETFPGIIIESGRQCSKCDEALKEHEEHGPTRKVEKEYLRLEMENLIAETRGKNKYDCMVFFSGGKDSTYLLWLLKEVYGLNVLAFTNENEFLSPIALENINQSIKALNVDHVWGKSPVTLLRRLFKERLLYASNTGISSVASVCEGCFNVTLLMGLKVAVQHNIPLMVNGLSPAQTNFAQRYRMPDDELRWMLTLLYENPIELFNITPTQQEYKPFLIPQWRNIRLPVMLYPFNVLDYNIPRNNEQILGQSLIKTGNEHPLRSNCLVNLVMLKFDTMRYGYGPYDLEFAHLIRDGQYNRDEWLLLYDSLFEAMGNDTFERENINLVLDRIGLRLMNSPELRFERVEGSRP